jgi:hypothetical protein
MYYGLGMNLIDLEMNSIPDLVGGDLNNIIMWITTIMSNNI